MFNVYIKLTLPIFVLFTAVVRADAPSRFAADRPVDCLHIKLDLGVDLENKLVTGSATLDFQALRDVSSIHLDAKELDIVRVLWGQEGQSPADVSFSNTGDRLDIFLPAPFREGQRGAARIDYRVDHPKSGLHFFGPTEDEPDVPFVVWSQGQATTNSYWFPCFDHPNERQTTELIVTAKKGFEVSGNGRLVSRKENADDGTETFHWLQDKPHVAYLVSLIVGEFHIEHDTWRDKSITYWAHPQCKDDLRRSFRNTKRMLDLFSDRIGIEYPWDRYAQICCEGFGGGMENTSATTLGVRALHDERSMIDADSDGLIAHELAHQWWGDLLTCRDWAHLWLNEGFASYFEALWDEHDLGDDEFRYNMYRKAESAKRGGKERPVVDRSYESAGSMFDSRAYPKGAWVLHMIRRRLGDDLFWKVLNRYATDHAYQTVETVDLRRTIELVTGRSFERFFYDWTDRPGHPEVHVSFDWDQDHQLAEITVKQSQEGDPFYFPFAFEFRFPESSEPVRLERLIEEKEVRFYHPLPGKPTMVRVDPDLSVLMDLKEKKGRDLWEAQLLRDPDPIGRIRAAKHFGESKSEADRNLLAMALSQESSWGVRTEMARALGESGGDVARDALIACLAGNNHKSRKACAEQLASFRKDKKAIAAVRAIATDGDASYYVEAAAVETYGKLEAEDAFAVLTDALSRDSRAEVIRQAALDGLASMRDPAVVPILADWTRPGKPRLARPGAIEALAKATTQLPLDDAAEDMVVGAIADCLNDSGVRVRRSAVQALGSLAEPGIARPVLADLRQVAAHDPDGRVREAAERSIKAIETGTPAPIILADFRKELDETKEKNLELLERLQKLEAVVGKDGDKSGLAASTEARPGADAGSSK